MNVKSRIYTESEYYQLSYDVFDCKGDLVKEGVFRWASKSLITLLLVERVVDQKGMEYVRSAYECAEEQRLPLSGASRTKEQVFEDFLLTVVVKYL